MGNQIPKEKILKYQTDINNIKSILENSIVYESVEDIHTLTQSIYYDNPFVFFKHFPIIENNCFTLNNEIYLDADFAVSIYSTKDDIIQILLNDIVIIEQQLYANTYSILKTNPIPLCSISYSWNKIKILNENPGDIHLICCYCCNTDFSDFLKKYTCVSISTIIFNGKDEREILYTRGKILIDNVEIQSFKDKWDGFDIIITIVMFALVGATIAIVNGKMK